MNQDKLVILKDGKEVECDIYFSLVCNETKKGYIGYTDHSINDKGEENIIVSTYDPNRGTESLGEITTDQEWDLVKNVIAKIKELN